MRGASPRTRTTVQASTKERCAARERNNTSGVLRSLGQHPPPISLVKLCVVGRDNNVGGVEQARHAVRGRHGAQPLNKLDGRRRRRECVVAATVFGPSDLDVVIKVAPREPQRIAHKRHFKVAAVVTQLGGRVPMQPERLDLTSSVTPILCGGCAGSCTCFLKEESSSATHALSPCIVLAPSNVRSSRPTAILSAMMTCSQKCETECSASTPTYMFSYQRPLRSHRGAC